MKVMSLTFSDLCVPAELFADLDIFVFFLFHPYNHLCSIKANIQVKPMYSV